MIGPYEKTDSLYLIFDKFFSSVVEMKIILSINKIPSGIQLYFAWSDVVWLALTTFLAGNKL